MQQDCCLGSAKVTLNQEKFKLQEMDSKVNHRHGDRALFLLHDCGRKG